ncbi:phosphate starvation-inducible protein PsiF [Nitrospirales bacterium NOB]|nr:MAG: phosphate starvation-inducible protein PsiF [Nitrospira sp. OLB3]MBV6470207.1 Phosphate starvation-inducible protein PsiF [Nitrospirota bacterium]MCE7964239.1 phosphate starvation-inducible protein PsiF [Nitrospira sp. NTP2]MCK6492684.1 PsiF family protein [Nitrospira sp.]MDL1890288.1 phosphate starvation-inducible protein PsiF [Nitrospirales bacterium NOB]MEB2337245.1 PsiF family protein [Nitrospirales bacterium]
MNHLAILLASAVASLWLITPPAGYAGALQNKMKACNAEADAQGLYGEGKRDERRAFMKACLSAKPAKAAAAPQEKMKVCNKEAKAKQLAGDERKKFMNMCLAG